MPIATDQQVQTFSDMHFRPHAADLREIYLKLKDDKSSFDDIYSNLTQSSPTWIDRRTDGVPHMLIPADLLALNALWTDLIAFIEGHSGWPIAEKSCINSVL